MNDSSGALGRKRDLDDQDRDRQVYRYLLTLSGLPMTNKAPQMPNETRLAEQWGFASNRIFVRRVLRSVLYEQFYGNKGDKQPPVPGLTLSKLVGILEALQNYQKREQVLDKDSKASHIITPEEKLKALSLFFQLSASERKRLSLQLGEGNVLLNQIVEKAADPSRPYSKENVHHLYRLFLQQSGEQSSKSFADALRDADEVTPQDFIKKVVAEYVGRRLDGLEAHDKIEVEKQLLDKVEREINRIELQSGRDQVKQCRSRDDSQGYEQFEYFTADFIRRLIQSVVDNVLITDQFPVYLKYFEIWRVKPLPLFICRLNQPNGLLNPFFLGDEQEGKSVEGLERQVAYRVRVHFYVNLPDDYTILFEDLSALSKVAERKRLDFSEEVVGIGCPTSHITTAINRVLFRDIPVLDGYMPIVDGVYCNDEVMGGTPNSPVWSHAVARLYKTEDVEAAIARDVLLDEVATRAETASADFCGFDLIETSAKAALLARLKLIKQVLSSHPGVSASEYISDLCRRIEESTALKKAQDAIDYYPFSLRAMEGRLEETILSPHRQRQPGFVSVAQASRDDWRVIVLEAQIAIAEAKLKEGLTHIARKYLEEIQPFFEGDISDKVSDLMLAKYYLCWFRYEYLSDLNDDVYPRPDRYFAVREAENYINKAEGCLQRRLKVYEKMDELPQANLHPQFHLLSRVYAHRAKLHIFFSKYMPRLALEATLLKPIEQLEKARIYAAQDGDPVMYAQWSAYQSWCYLMLAYLGNFESPTLDGFDYDGCLDWASGLVDHANLCYSANGKICYQRMKDAGGRTTQYVVMKETADGKVQERYYDKYGSTMIEMMPLIRELPQTEQDMSSQPYMPESNVMSLDFSLLKKVRSDDNSSIYYLFGMQSSILLFAQGMLTLCERYESDEELSEAIEKTVMRLFTYCCAIASDGTVRNENPATWPTNTAPGSIVLDRAFPDESAAEDLQSRDRLLQGLYPHRLTQFTDLGKIFIVVCELILLFSISASVAKSKKREATAKISKIRRLIKELKENDQLPVENGKKEACGQKRYNAHLAEHYVQFESYVEKFLAKLQSNKAERGSSIHSRNQIVTAVFRIIRGEINVLP